MTNAYPYPSLRVWKSDDYSDVTLSGDPMNFRLVYEGPLKATTQNSTRSQHKHEIRQALHPQLKKLWAERLPLSDDAELQQKLGNEFRRCDHQFVPLVNKELELVCTFDILFLRREAPGDLIKSGGDLDNRLKTLFDALRVPDSCANVSPPTPDEQPYFYCLLQDDKQVTAFSITTDRLLTPLKPNQGENDVVLIMQVSVQSMNPFVAGFRLA